MNDSPILLESWYGVGEWCEGKTTFYPLSAPKSCLYPTEECRLVFTTSVHIEGAMAIRTAFSDKVYHIQRIDYSPDSSRYGNWQSVVHNLGVAQLEPIDRPSVWSRIG